MKSSMHNIIYQTKWIAFKHLLLLVLDVISLTIQLSYLTNNNNAIIFALSNYPSFCSIFKTFHKPREGWWCSLSHLMLREVALSTLTSPYQYPTKPLPSLDVIPFDQTSINKLDRLKLQF